MKVAKNEKTKIGLKVIMHKKKDYAFVVKKSQ